MGFSWLKNQTFGWPQMLESDRLESLELDCLFIAKIHCIWGIPLFLFAAVCQMFLPLTLPCIHLNTQHTPSICLKTRTHPIVVAAPIHAFSVSVAIVSTSALMVVAYPHLSPLSPSHFWVQTLVGWKFNKNKKSYIELSHPRPRNAENKQSMRFVLPYFNDPSQNCGFQSLEYNLAGKCKVILTLSPRPESNSLDSICCAS